MTEYIRRIGKYAFTIGIIFETLFVLLDKSSYIIQHETWAFRITFLLFACKIACTKYTKREWVAILAMIGVGVISYFATDREEVIRMVALVVACKDIDIRAMMKLIFVETLIGCLIIMGLSFIGIGGEVAITDMFRGGGIEETRYCFGMGHPNAFHCMFLAVVVLGLYVYNDYVKWWGYLLLGVMDIVLFLMTDSKTGVFFGFFAIILFAIIRYVKMIEYKRWPYWASEILLLGCLGFSILAASGGEGEYSWILPINRLLNGRLQFAFWQGGVSTWSLFSQLGTEFYFDMGWVRLFYWYGIIPAVLYFILLGLTLWQCYQYRDGKALVVLDVFIAYTVLEAHAISVYLGRNYMLFIIGMYWTSMLYRKEKGDNS